MVVDSNPVPPPTERRQDGPEPAAGPGTADPVGDSAPSRPTGWKFIAMWIAFALTFLLTLVLGVQVVLGTKGLG